MPTKAPSSLSRNNADDFWVFETGMESILGKRKSELHPPPSTKRYATTSPPNAEGPHNKARNRARPESPSSSSDEDGLERMEQDGKADVSRDLLPPQPRARSSPASDLHESLPVSRKHIFETRVVHRRQSTSTFESPGDIAERALDNACRKDAGWVASSSPQKHNPEFPIVYRIECSERSNKSRHHETFLYEDDPFTADFAEGRRSSHLSGKEPIYQLQNYMRRFQLQSFVIIKNRQCGALLGFSHSQRGRDESILILNDELRQAIQKVATCSLDKFLNNGSFEVHAPYQLLFFHRELLQTYSQTVNSMLRKEIEAVVRYIVTNYGDEYAEAAKLISQGKSTIRHLDKMFQPNDLMVISDKYFTTDRSDLERIVVVEDWPRVKGTVFWVPYWSWKFTSWECDRSHEEVGFHVPAEDETEPFSLEEFGLFPISVLSEASLDSLCKRGRKCWDLRQPSFIHCKESQRIKPGRYMIDHTIYQRLHPIDHTPGVTRNKQTDTWSLKLNFEVEPAKDEFLMMPTTLPGYDLLEKEWVSLHVSKISPISWNKQPFDDLVLPEETKRLVRAMVTVRASSIRTKREELMRTNFDIIRGKGNGLIMLFHGSPGTGKTLTAESVSEIAEMPLYPITCGDIGTEPEKVEQYLQLVFELGQRWNCVLLLDEADVFLEERTLTDLQRNSLVSVFLRMLEYYEGILILTSNRVGTFDEAFRSRINIALHYEDLKPRSRRQIWSNSLSRLEGTGEDENLDEIKQRLDELANHKLNGREIRNAISTARQLASYEGKNMGWEHLELAIMTANKFGNYLRDVHGHSDNDWAKERRERL